MRHLAGRKGPSCVIWLSQLARALWSGLVLAHGACAHRLPATAAPESSPTNSTDNAVSQRARHRSLEPLHPELRLAQAGMSWKEERRSTDGETVSVIVVEWRHHESNYFRDRERVRAFGSRVDGGGGAAVTSVQFASPYPEESLEEARGAPFGAAHPEGVDKRVRIVYIADFFGKLTKNQEEHLTAACEDRSETTLLVIIDETCRWDPLERKLPTVCLTNVARTYPSNVARPKEDELFRTAYLPLGPRDTFPFISADRRLPASLRPLLFNLLVRPRTSERRKTLVDIVHDYSDSNGDVKSMPARGRPLDPDQYQTALLNSRFTLSPAGHNAECFRTWEALEAGSIPIVSRLDFTEQEYWFPKDPPGSNCGEGTVGWNTVAGSPFAKEVSVLDWYELPQLLDRLQKESDDYIDKLQEDSVAWYEAVMKQAYRSMINFGEDHDLLPQEGPIVHSLPGP